MRYVYQENHLQSHCVFVTGFKLVGCSSIFHKVRESVEITAWRSVTCLAG